MIRFLLRSVGFLLMAAAFAALVVDGTRSIAGGRLMQYALGDDAAWLGGAPYAALGQALEHLPETAQRMAFGLLALPGWLVAGVLGLVCLHVGRSAVSGAGPAGPRG